MKVKNNKFFTSPSDLNNFIACKYTALNEIKFHKKEIKKSNDKANDELWKKMGIEHEKKHYKLFKDKLPGGTQLGEPFCFSCTIISIKPCCSV